jgi:predicted alpha/beta hydrolase family esterase
MTKQLLFVHGGDSLNPGETFFSRWESESSWLRSVSNPFVHVEKQKRWKDDLVERLGDEWACVFPRMPNDMAARYEEWKWMFEKYVPHMNDGIVLIGHSLGANFLAQYLATVRLPVRVSQLHLVAGCTKEGNFAIPDSLALLEEQCAVVYVYHSTDDPVVPFAAAEEYVKKLPEAELVVFSDRGHFLGESFPELVERVLRV